MIVWKLPTRFKWGGKTVRLDLRFDNVLRMFELQKDEILDDVDKLTLSLSVLVRNYRRFSRLPLGEQKELEDTIFEEFIYPEEQNKAAGEPPVVAFVQDAPYIYAAFRMDYGIDLQKQIGRRRALDWRAFLALFRGLSKNTKMREIMEIRAAKIPMRTKHNAEQIQNMLQLKAFYRIRVSEQQAHENMQKGLAGFANMAARMAEQAKKRR